MKTIEKVIFYLLLIVLYSAILYYWALPKIIERRARNLALMQYDGEKDKFVAKDSLLITGWDLYYLQYGSMKGY